MRWYQDSRGYDSLYFEGPAGGLLGGVDGKLYTLESGRSDAGVAIELTWISKFTDQGAPNNQKTYQDLVIDHNTGGSTASVKAAIDNGYTVVNLGSITSTERTQTVFRIGTEEGTRGKNFAALIECTKSDALEAVVQLYGVFLHYYVEARGALTWDSDELDAGMQKVKALRAVELDINNPGAVTVEVYTDMPGNNMALRAIKAVPASTTRRKYQVPLGRPYFEGRHVRAIVMATDGVTEFQLYGARLEVQPFGEYVEGYEAGAGREWDSGTLDLGIPHVKEIRETQLDIDTDGALTFDLWTELPGLGMISRVTKTVNTETTTTGRRMVNLPLFDDGVPVEGRLVRMFLRGSAAWRLYGAWLFRRPIGYYVEAYQAQTGHIWDSTVLDLGMPHVKRLLQLQFEAHCDSPVTVKTYTSNAHGDMALRATDTLASSTTRRPYVVQLAAVYGRLVRVTLTSTAAFRLFSARISVKPIGVYLNGGTDEMYPVEAEQDLNSERVKLFKEIEVVYQNAGGTGALSFYSDPLGEQALVRTFPLPATTGTETLKLRLPGNAKGRLVRVEVTPGTGDLELFQVRVWARLEGEAGAMNWSWIPLPVPQTPDNYQFVDLYVAPTPPAYEWAPIYVPETRTEVWNWLDLPVNY